LIINLIVTVMMIVSAGMRYEQGTNYTLTPVLISVASVLLAGISGWLGGELVSSHGISVHEDALSHRGVRDAS
jgi:uncharacterized membrane protein